MSQQIVRLEVDGRDIELNPFVRQLFAGVIRGLIGALKGVDQPRKVVISVESPMGALDGSQGPG